MSDVTTTCKQSLEKLVVEVLMLYFWGGSQLVGYTVPHLGTPTTRPWPPSGLKKNRVVKAVPFLGHSITTP